MFFGSLYYRWGVLIFPGEFPSTSAAAPPVVPAGAPPHQPPRQRVARGPVITVEKNWCITLR